MDCPAEKWNKPACIRSIGYKRGGFGDEFAAIGARQKSTPQLSKKTRPGCQGVSLILLLSSSFAQEITI